VRYFHFHPFV